MGAPTLDRQSKKISRNRSGSSTPEAVDSDSSYSDPSDLANDAQPASSSSQAPIGAEMPTELSRFSWRRLPLSRLFVFIGVLNLAALLGGVGLLARDVTIMNESIESNGQWNELIGQVQELDGYIVELRLAGESMYHLSHESAQDEHHESLPMLDQALAGIGPIVGRIRLELDVQSEHVDVAAAQVQLNVVERGAIRSHGVFTDLYEQVMDGRVNQARETRRIAILHSTSARGWAQDLIEEISNLQARQLQDQAEAAQTNEYWGWTITAAALAALLGTLMFGRRLSHEASIRAQEAAKHEETLRNSQQVQAFNRRLQESNRDLQDFAHVASHDLQEPLRKIIAFGDRLRSRSADDLDERSIDYLDRIQGASSRMQRLIEDLLTFSRVSTQGKELQLTNLSDVVVGVVSDLEVAIDDAGATVNVNKLPVVSSDPSQMRQVLQNLIGNALKFRAEGTAPVVTVSASEISADHEDAPDEPLPDGSTGWVQISVADNGIGFDMKYIDKVFTVFQRLHGRAEYEGSGVGLAVCRRIAERHGGELTAVSALGEGTIFTFTIPAIAVAVPASKQ